MKCGRQTRCLGPRWAQVFIDFRCNAFIVSDCRYATACSESQLPQKKLTCRAGAFLLSGGSAATRQECCGILRTQYMGIECSAEEHDSK